MLAKIIKLFFFPHFLAVSGCPGTVKQFASLTLMRVLKNSQISEVFFVFVLLVLFFRGLVCSNQSIVEVQIRLLRKLMKK